MTHSPGKGRLSGYETSPTCVLRGKTKGANNGSNLTDSGVNKRCVHIDNTHTPTRFCMHKLWKDKKQMHSEGPWEADED